MILNLAVTVKKEPDANPYKQISKDMQEKRFKAEQGIVILVTGSWAALQQFWNDAIIIFGIITSKSLMQYLIIFILLRNYRRY